MGSEFDPSLRTGEAERSWTALLLGSLPLLGWNLSGEVMEVDAGGVTMYSSDEEWPGSSSMGAGLGEGRQPGKLVQSSVRPKQWDHGRQER